MYFTYACNRLRIDDAYIYSLYAHVYIYLYMGRSFEVSWKVTYSYKKELELQVVHAAAEHAQKELTRIPNAMKLETLPSFAEQQKHFFTHLPYAPWCSSCVCFRARSDSTNDLEAALHAYPLTLGIESLCPRALMPRRFQRLQIW